MRYLTKSLFKIAENCPASLFYAANPQRYYNMQLDDEFLHELANYGFQIGELAKSYFPGGAMIDSPDHNVAVEQTSELLQRDRVIIYEAAFCVDNFFIRADILRKNEDSIDLIEVKSTSYDPAQYGGLPFMNSRGVASDRRSYLEDVAFQKYVLSKAIPGWPIHAYLMLPDKSKGCPSETLAQKFRIFTDERGQSHCRQVEALTPEELSNPILTAIPVDEQIEWIYKEENNSFIEQCKDWVPGFRERAESFGKMVESRIECRLHKGCKACPYDTATNQATILQSGRKECFQRQYHWHDEDFAEPSIFDIWRFRMKNEYLDQQQVKLRDFDQSLLVEKKSSTGAAGMSTIERQLLQIQKALANDRSIFCVKDQLRQVMDTWVYPLHFIDFETAMPVIPFVRGLRPFEGVAFQFSHHMLHADGRVEHAGEFLSTTAGVLPNYQFVRELQRQLGSDNGTIFRYSNHENTFLNLIYRQLSADRNGGDADREDLLKFIRSITHASGASGKSEENWCGERDMVDQCDIVTRYYFDPATGGSNSIKAVLPAILNSSRFLQATYSQPLSAIGVTSRNFSPEHIWLQRDESGEIVSPYHALPPLIPQLQDGELAFFEQDELNNGGAALLAYAKLQYGDMPHGERDELNRALKRYCELDTLAMVMLQQAWMELIRET